MLEGEVWGCWGRDRAGRDVGEPSHGGWRHGGRGGTWRGESGLEGEMGAGMVQGPRTSGPTGEWQGGSVVLLIYRKGNEAVLFV